MTDPRRIPETTEETPAERVRRMDSALADAAARTARLEDAAAELAEAERVVRALDAYYRERWMVDRQALEGRPEADSEVL